MVIDSLKKIFSISVFTIISIIIFVFVAIIFQGKGPNDDLKILLQVSSFLFGIFVAFSITHSYSRLNKISETLEEDEGILLFFFKVADIFGSSAKRGIQTIIDSYLIDQIDYYLVDFKYSNNSFFKLFQYIMNLKPENKSQEVIHSKMIDLLLQSTKNRKKVELLVQQPMLKFEWVAILSLFSVILFCIFYLNKGTVVSITTSVLLSTSATILVLILRDLNNLSWKERRWVWEDLKDLFYELDLLPYYPLAVVKSGKAKLQKGQRVRVARYSNPYPDMIGKVVEIIDG